MSDAFADGVVIVLLAPITDPALITLAIAQALDVREADEDVLLDRLKVSLREQRRLLVLDNFEQVVEAAPLVAELLAACPGLKVLVTSRVRLRASSEQEHAVPPLGVTTLDGPSCVEQEVAGDAVRLLVARARAVKRDFVVTPQNAGTLAEICRRLDGLPLAIELAAARVKVLPPPALLARLEKRLPVLTGGARDLPARQQTMRDAIAWSFDLLTPQEQTLFRRLAVFTGGLTLEAVEAVAAVPGDPGMKVLDGIGSLVDRSLLREEDGPAGEPRYLMLETIREYGLERLAESGEDEDVRRRHADHFAAFADRIGTDCVWRPDPHAAFVRLDAEQDNLRAALTWASEHDEMATLARLAVGLRWSWLLHGGLSEGRTWLDRVVRVIDAVPLPLRAAVLNAAAWHLRQQGDLANAEFIGEQSLTLFREDGDAMGEFEALSLLGFVTEDRGEFSRSLALREEALHILRQLDEPIRTGWAMRSVGATLHLCGDTEAAEAILGDALALFRQERSEHGAGLVLSDLATIAYGRGEYARAAELWQEQLHLTWNVWDLRWSLECLGFIAVACGEADRGVRLLGAAEAVRERLGTAVPPSEVPQHEASAAAARSALGEAMFAAAWEAGRRMSPEEARVEAAQVARTPQPPTHEHAATSASTHGLTSRELDVLALLVEGRSNREIAEALFVSPRTVDNHVTNILAKLEVKSRTAAVAAARRLGLA
ncbi:MAG: LuxR C-terminal-related transcriptional regulator [Chloroflexota bacterium]|nr:LuxR C-terminal-related transcriptional regulator [Chloroflexota bacterium]